MPGREAPLCHIKEAHLVPGRAENVSYDAVLSLHQFVPELCSNYSIYTDRYLTC